MLRFAFFRAAIRRPEISTANQRRIDDLVDTLKNINGVTGVEVYSYSAKITFLEDVISVAELDAIVTALFMDAALNSPLFPDVKKNGKIRRHPATAELKLDAKTFKVIMGSSDKRPTDSKVVVNGVTDTKLVFDLNTMIAGIDPKDGARQPKVLEEFKDVFGAKLAKHDGVIGVTVWETQLEISFYETLLSRKKIVKLVKAALDELVDDTEHSNFFPHVRSGDKPLEITKVWLAKK